MINYGIFGIWPYHTFVQPECKFRVLNNCKMRSSEGSDADDDSLSAPVNVAPSSLQRRKQLSTHSKRRSNNSGAGATSATRYELKKALEKKFRLRYLTLQHTYEQRLRALALQVQQTVDIIQNDATIHHMQEDPLTQEYARERLGEIVRECFHSEREKYIKTLSEHGAWQANDLREMQDKLQAVSAREQQMEQALVIAQRDVKSLQQQLAVRSQELQAEKQLLVQRQDAHQVVCGEKEALRYEVMTLTQKVHTFETLQQDYETLQAQERKNSDQGRAMHEQTIKLTEELHVCQSVSYVLWYNLLLLLVTHLSLNEQKLELEKHASQQEAAHLKQLLSMAEAKSNELNRSLQQLTKEDYPSRVARLEAQLVQQKQSFAVLEKEKDALSKKYEEFGEQVDIYMQEQAKEKATVLEDGEKQVTQLRNEIAAVRQQAQDALKTKQAEVLRALDQAKFRHEALQKTEQKNLMLQEQIAATEKANNEESLRHAKQISVMEKELTQWRHGVQKEQEKVKQLEQALLKTRDDYERNLAALESSVEQHKQQNLKEKELEARTRWQNDFALKQEARIDALKAKYDAALENQQAELLRARQMAMDTATATAAKLEKSLLLDKTKRSERNDEEEIRKLRLELLAKEKECKEKQARDTARLRHQHELEEREKRLVERERLVNEKEQRVLQKRAEKAKQPAMASPRVLVMNVHANGEDVEKHKSESNGAVTVVSQSRPTKAEDSRKHQDCIPIAQHKAELDAKEAQAALQSEERLKAGIHDYQLKKEKEFRAAMVNVRKGIQKLESSLDEARTEKKSIEEQLLSERQAFVSLKQELDDTTEAKRVIVQRLEDANDNIGKLLKVAKESQAKCQELEKQLDQAIQSNKHDSASADAAKQTCQELNDEIKRLTSAKIDLQMKLDDTDERQKQLRDHVSSLENQIRVLDEEHSKEKNSWDETKKNELAAAASQYDSRAAGLKSELEELRSRYELVESSHGNAEQTLIDLNREKKELEDALAKLKSDSVQQRKEFKDLARMYKSLSEAMQQKTGIERADKTATEVQLQEVKKRAQLVAAEKKRALQESISRLDQLRMEYDELKRGVVTELKTTWKGLKHDFALSCSELRKYAEDIRLKESIAWRQKLKEEKRAWKSKMEQKEREAAVITANYRLADQTKLDQMTLRLEYKVNELEQVQARYQDLHATNDKLQQEVRQMEIDYDRRVLEQSQLSDRLSVTQNATEQEAKQAARLQALLARRTKICQLYHGFVTTTMKDFGVASPGILLRETDGKWQDEWEEQQLSLELERLQELLSDHMQSALSKVKQDSVSSFAAELEAAKRTLQSYWDHLDTSSTDDLNQHLPWYVVVSRTFKQAQEERLLKITNLSQELAEREMEVHELSQNKEQLQETQRMLQFERETLMREMNVQGQNLQKKKDQETTDLRLEWERKVETLKHRHEKENINAKEELRVLFTAPIFCFCFCINPICTE